MSDERESIGLGKREEKSKACSAALLTRNIMAGKANHEMEEEDVKIFLHFCLLLRKQTRKYPLESRIGRFIVSNWSAGMKFYFDQVMAKTNRCRHLFACGCEANARLSMHVGINV